MIIKSKRSCFIQILFMKELILKQIYCFDYKKFAFAFCDNFNRHPKHTVNNFFFFFELEENIPEKQANIIWFCFLYF